MGDQSNRWRGMRWRELVALTLQLSGFDDATARPLTRRPSEAFDDDEPRPDILNVPGWHLDAAADLQARWGVRLDSAEQAAALSGTPNAAVAFYRQGRPTSEAYVLMTLDQFARAALAAEAAPQPVDV